MIEIAKNKILNFYKNIKNEIVWTVTGLIVGALVSFIITNSVWESKISKERNKIRIENVKHFIEHPSMYKLDTLYRKSNDTLFIDSIKVNYK